MHAAVDVVIWTPALNGLDSGRGSRNVTFKAKLSVMMPIITQTQHTAYLRRSVIHRRKASN